MTIVASTCSVHAKTLLTVKATSKRQSLVLVSVCVRTSITVIQPKCEPGGRKSMLCQATDANQITGR